jgi:hypothetical protein
MMFWTGKYSIGSWGGACGSASFGQQQQDANSIDCKLEREAFL